MQLSLIMEVTSTLKGRRLYKLCILGTETFWDSFKTDFPIYQYMTCVISSEKYFTCISKNSFLFIFFNMAIHLTLLQYMSHSKVILVLSRDDQLSVYRTVYSFPNKFYYHFYYKKETMSYL
jgi:hypothetical protein